MFSFSLVQDRLSLTKHKLNWIKTECFDVPSSYLTIPVQNITYVQVSVYEEQVEDVILVLF